MAHFVGVCWRWPALLALLLAAAVPTAAVGNHRRHHQRHQETAASASTAAAVDEAAASAEAVVEAAEKEAGQEEAQAAPSLVVATAGEQQQKAAVAALGTKASKDKNEDADEDDDDEDDSDDSDDDDDPGAGPTAGAVALHAADVGNVTEVKKLTITIPSATGPGGGSPGSVVPMREQAPEGYTLEANYGVHDGILRGESLTPNGQLAKARQRLQDNLFKQAKLNTLIWDMQNETGFQSRVDSETSRLAGETQAQALATMLGGMRKEMRKFAAPFYLEHLISERNRLQSNEVVLQADLDAAQAALGRGHEGWPHPGRNVVVAESTFRRPAALRGADGAEEPVADFGQAPVALVQQKQKQKSGAAAAASFAWGSLLTAALAL